MYLQFSTSTHIKSFQDHFFGGCIQVAEEECIQLEYSYKDTFSSRSSNFVEFIGFVEFFHGVESTCLPYLTRTAHSASLFESRCVSRLLLSQLRPPATLNLIFIHHCFNKQQSIWNQKKNSFNIRSGKLETSLWGYCITGKHTIIKISH